MQVALLVLVFAALAFGQLPAGPVNLNFANGVAGQVPPGWFVPTAGMGYRAELRRQGCRGAAGCAVVINPAEPKAEAFGNLMQTFDAAAYRGKTIRLRAWVKLEAVADQDRAQMWLRVDRPNQTMGLFDNMGQRPVTTAEWRECEISGPVDNDAVTINIGLMSIGKGRAWIDGVRFEAEAPKPPGAEETAIRKELEGLYQRMDDAVAKGQVDAVAALTTPDAVIDVGYGPTRPFSLAIEEMKKQLAGGVRMTSRHKLTSVQVTGDTATVMTESENTIQSPSGTQGSVGTARDVWVRTAQGWRLKSTAPLSQRAVLAGTDAETTKSVAAELKQRAAPLKTSKAGSGFDDLKAFGEAIGDARIVALGEATHGTKEFFEMKHRVLEYLVREKGFTVFAIEANWPEGLVGDRYVKAGEGDGRKALSAMYFWTWNTKEVLGMIEWMRAFNQAAGAHLTLTFTSFDMQTHRVALERAAAYLKKVSPAAGATAEKAYQEVNRRLGPTVQPNSPDAKIAAEQAATVVKVFDDNRSALTAKSSPEEWRDARQAAEIVRQACVLRSPDAGNSYRDQMMARNVEWLLKDVHPNEKIVLWAHNGHVSTDGQFFKPMGVWLRERFGKQMYVAGFAFRGGELQAMGRGRQQRGLAVHQAPPSPEGSGDAVLSAAGMPIFFLDMRRVPAESKLGRWLAEPHLFYNLGAIWMMDDPAANRNPATMSKAYDGLFFFENTHAAEGFGLVRQQ